MTSEELAFIAALDAEPENHTTRLVFADWLDDRGDPRAAGYRAMGRLGLFPHRDRTDLGSGEVYFAGWLCEGFAKDRPDSEHLPRAWSDAIDMHLYASRAAAEDAAALAWAKLTPEQQARILAGVPG